MKSNQYKILILLSFIIFFTHLFSKSKFISPIIRYDSFIISNPNYIFQLKEFPIIIDSEEISVDSIVLKKNIDYQLDYFNGILTLKNHNLRNKNLFCIYKVYPKSLQDTLFIFTPQSYSDSLNNPNNLIYKKKRYYDSNLNISGSKTISISLESNRDINFDQSLFLQIDGKIAKNVFMKAQLSDSESPFTPEGDSKELSSLDQVFINIYNDDFFLQFGDIKYEISNTEFSNIKRSMEGFAGEWKKNFLINGTYAVTKGIFKTTTIHGTDGKQGPYYLLNDGAYQITQVLAGSERIVLNGQIMERGDDYTINYDEGSITFNQNRVITSDSEISAEFLYSDENYKKQFYAISGKNQLNLFKLYYSFIVQNDDKKNPLNDSFSQTELDSLKTAGDNIIWVDNFFETDPNQGDYVLISDSIQEYFLYVGQNNGNFDVGFSYVGENHGDYKRLTTNEFQFVGKNNGSWLPQKKIIPPEKLNNFDFGLKLGNDKLSLNSEIIVTNYDKNTFSKMDDNDNFGYALSEKLNWSPNLDKLNPSLNVAYTHYAKNLQTFANLNNIEESYNQTVFTELDSLESDNYMFLFSLRNQDSFSNNFHVKYSDLKTYSVQRYFNNNLQIKEISILPSLQNNFIYREENFENNKSKQYLNSNTKLTKQIFFNQIELSQDVSKLFSKNEEQQTDLKQNNKKYHFSFTQNKKHIYSYLNEFSWENNTLNTIINSQTKRKIYKTTQSINTSSHRISLTFSHTDTEKKEQQTKDKTTYDLLEITSSNSFFKNSFSTNLNYSINNLEFFPKDQVLTYVGTEAGLYDSTGTFVGQGIGDYDYEVVNVGNPKLLSEIKFSLRLFLKFNKLKNNNLLKRINLESYIFQEEQSNSLKKTKLYLLRPEVTFNDSTTLYGKKSFRETLWFKIIEGKLNSRYEYEYHKTLDNRYLEKDIERLNRNEIYLAWIGNFHEEFNFTFEHKLEEDSHYHSKIISHLSTFGYRRDLLHFLTLENDLTYLDEKGSRLNSEIRYKLKAISNAFKITISPSLEWQAFTKFEIGKNQKTGDDFLNFLPEKRKGIFYIINSMLNYKMNTFTNLYFSYSAKKYPQDDLIHNLSLEISAEF